MEGLRADIFDRQRRIVIEAKAYNRDDVVVLGAITQAMLYRSIANHDLNADIIDSIAVLLPGRPSERARRVARQWELTCDVIYPDGDGDGDGFRQEPFK